MQKIPIQTDGKDAMRRISKSQVVNMAYPTGFMSDLFVAAAFENVRFRLYEALRQMKNNQGEQI